MTAPYIPAHTLTRLKDACEEGDASIIQEVLDQHPTAANAWIMIVQMTLGTKPLLLAAQHGDYDSVKTLLMAGADVEARMHIQLGYVGSDRYLRENCTALLKTLQSGHNKDLAALLLEYRADITAQTGSKANAVHCAAQGRNIDALEFVLERVPPEYINHIDEDGVTPLILACRQENSEDMVTLLIDKKADINKQATFGQTPLEALVTRGVRDTFIEFMVNAGADINAVNNKSGMTSLMVAAEKGMENTMRALLANGADPYMHNDKRNISTLGYASTQGGKDIILKAQAEIELKKTAALFTRANQIVQSGTREKTQLMPKIKIMRPF